jgi:hypothetical protein
MRKRIIPPGQPDPSLPDDDWLNPERLAQIELTSEEASHPIQSALLAAGGSGRRAAGPGGQTIRFLFAQPQRRIWLQFIEPVTERTQE